MRLLLLGGFLALAFSSRAQPSNILISSAGAPSEPSICIDPRNPANMVAGANLSNLYYSTDTGATWTRQILTSPYGVWGDPVIGVDTHGHFYYFHLSAPNGGPFSPTWIDRIVSQKFYPGSATFTPGTFTGLNGTKEQDKEWVAIDWRTNAIYLTWTQFDNYGSYSGADSSQILFSKSTDTGATWSTPVRINKVGGDCIDSSNTVEGAVPTIGPNGEVYVAWAGPAGIRFDRSLNGGATWLAEDILVDPMTAGWSYNVPGVNRCNGLPFTVCDISNGPHRGTIYINWTDQRNGPGNTDVFLSRSTDGGNTWSAPIRVNDDPLTTPRHQFLSSLTIDQATGLLYCVFYDRRDYTTDATDVYMAVSSDGGQTFVNSKISASPFTPFSTVFFGDYTYVAAHNGVVRPIWTRMVNGQTSIWTAKVSGQTTGLGSTPSAVFEEAVAYPNPFEETTHFSFKLRESATVDLWVSDIHGRRVAVLMEGEKLPIGKYIEHFDPRTRGLAPGLYSFCLRVGGKVRTQRIVFGSR
jgi:hypothetical protein